jgi:hypothetical protein
MPWNGKKNKEIADWGDFSGIDKSVNIVKLDSFRKT